MSATWSGAKISTLVRVRSITSTTNGLTSPAAWAAASSGRNAGNGSPSIDDLRPSAAAARTRRFASPWEIRNACATNFSTDDTQCLAVRSERSTAWINR